VANHTKRTLLKSGRTDINGNSNRRTVVSSGCEVTMKLAAFGENIHLELFLTVKYAVLIG